MTKSRIYSIFDRIVDIAEYGLKKLVSLSWDIERSRSNSALLGTAIVLLSLASGYTTFNGFLNYLDSWVIALLITFGIQSLLAVSSWQFGSYPTKIDIPIGLYIVFIITFSTSVFFSFSEYFSKIYTKDIHQNEYNLNVELLFDDVYQTLKKKLRQKEKNNTLEIEKFLVNYEKNAFLEAVIIQRHLKQELTKYKAKENSEGELKKLEAENGGTIVNGIKTKKGYGKIAKSHEHLKKWYRKNYVEPLESNLDAYAQRLSSFRNAVKALSESTKDSSLIEIENILSLSEKCIEFIEFNSFPINLSPNENVCKVNLKILNIINELKEINQYKDISILFGDTIEKIQTKNISSIINLITSFPEEESGLQPLLSKVADLRTDQNTNLHFFRSGLTKIAQFNSLAIVSLVIAIFVDLLILFCGLLGAKQKSFLDVYSSSDLRHMKERAIENVMSINKHEEDGDSLLVKNVKRLMRVSEYDPSQIEHGFASIIKPDVVKREEIEEWIGVFVALGLATRLQPQPNGESEIGLHVRLYLWMSEIVNKGTDSGELLASLQKLLGDLKIRNIDRDSNDLTELETLYKKLKQAFHEENR